MATNDLVQCPLCSGHGRMEREELVEILTDPNLDQKIAQQVIDLTRTPAAELVGAGPAGFERDVHSWNPSQPMWRRSPKE
jgi:hypothetical protein